MSLLPLLLTALAQAACGDVVESVDTSVCASGSRWIGGTMGSDEMMPGRPCLACHAREDGPKFAAAGTVYSALKEADECFGLSGVVVTITGADGTVVSVPSNEAGNFSFPGQIATPYRASISFDGVDRPMATPQVDGDCNTCHSPAGSGNAPGRIFMF